MSDDADSEFREWFDIWIEKLPDRLKLKCSRWRMLGFSRIQIIERLINELMEY